MAFAAPVHPCTMHACVHTFLNNLIPYLTEIDDLVRRVLRGEEPAWPAQQHKEFEESLLQRGMHHGVVPLLYHRMKDAASWNTWPGNLRAEFEALSKSAVAQDLLREHYLTKIMNALSTRGIRFLLIKGEALARTHYPIPGTRVRVDSDLFIDIADIASARQSIVGAGFVIVSTLYKSHQFTVRRSVGGIEGFEFDIHWRLLNASRYARSISFLDAWNGSIELPHLEGICAPNAKHALMVSCMHRVASRWHDQNRLLWIYDIHLLVSAMNSDEMRRFSAEAVVRNVQTACRDGLARAHDCFATVLDEQSMKALAVTEVPQTFAYSNLGLLVDDWRRLASFSARMAILGELFLPSGTLLLDKYGRESRWWLPALYLRQIFSGIFHRLTLR